jgi:nitric oxide dioxygenase
MPTLQRKKIMTITLTKTNDSFTVILQDLIEYPNQGILSKVLLKDNNCQYTLFCLAKGTEIEEHTSTRNVLVSVIEGEGILTLNSEEIPLKTGVLVFMPANAPHALQANENLSFLLTLSEQKNHKKT